MSMSMSISIEFLDFKDFILRGVPGDTFHDDGTTRPAPKYNESAARRIADYTYVSREDKGCDLEVRLLVVETHHDKWAKSYIHAVSEGLETAVYMRADDCLMTRLTVSAGGASRQLRKATPAGRYSVKGLHKAHEDTRDMFAQLAAGPATA